MDASDERALKILDAFSNLPREEGPVTLSREYLDDIAAVESLPQNQSGADKSWVHRLLEKSRRNHATAVPKP